MSVNVIDSAHLAHQREFSARTFGPGARTAGCLDHIRKELVEIAAAPEDVTEWADLIILAFDGALRAGHAPQAIIDAVKAKQAMNETREWPDWRTQDPDKAIEHVRPRPDYGDRAQQDSLCALCGHTQTPHLMSTDDRCTRTGCACASFTPSVEVEVDPDRCPLGPRHVWAFDGDDPYVLCECGQIRDALTDRVITIGNDRYRW